MKSLPALASALLIALTPALTACGGGGGGSDGFIKPGEERSALAIWIWLAADQDTSVRCDGPFCTGGDSLYGFDPLLDVADNASQTARSYVQFTMPNLPAGANVEEAYLELYQAGGSNASFGQDFVGVIPVEAPWRPDTTTYNTQPPSIPGQNEFNVTPSGNASGWWTSPNLKRYADYKLGNPQFNYGFVTTNPKAVDAPTAPSTQRAYTFRSNNFGDRTTTNVGTGPRFVLKVRLPIGAGIDDVSLPPVPPGSDIPGAPNVQLGRAALRAGENAPTQWNVGGGR